MPQVLVCHDDGDGSQGVLIPHQDRVRYVGQQDPVGGEKGSPAAQKYHDLHGDPNEQRGYRQ